MRFLRKYEAHTFALVRLVAGILFACHGAQKLFGAFGSAGAGDNALMWVAGVVEFGGGVLIALGLWAGPAAFVASGQMAVAYFKAHAPGGFWPIVNHGELAMLNCFLFLHIAAHGSGIWSVDQILARKRRPA
jgi:putative oxidoreductase